MCKKSRGLGGFFRTAWCAPGQLRMVGCAHQAPGEAFFAWLFQKGTDGDNKCHLLTWSPGTGLTTGVTVPRMLGPLTKQAFME